MVAGGLRRLVEQEKNEGILLVHGTEDDAGAEAVGDGSDCDGRRDNFEVKNDHFDLQRDRNGLEVSGSEGLLLSISVS